VNTNGKDGRLHMSTSFLFADALNISARPNICSFLRTVVYISRSFQGRHLCTYEHPLFFQCLNSTIIQQYWSEVQHYSWAERMKTLLHRFGNESPSLIASLAFAGREVQTTCRLFPPGILIKLGFNAFKCCMRSTLIPLGLLFVSFFLSFTSQDLLIIERWWKQTYHLEL
jgi:hypothetical protein